MIRLVLLALIFSTGIAHALDPKLDAWVSNQFNVSTNGVLRNISQPGTLPGTVIASPSKVEPDYYYHWVRDAALTMNAMMNVYQALPDGALKNRIFNEFINFVKLEQLHQEKHSPAGFGEPKFHVNGEPFVGPWGRPQNDGPALRAVTMMRFARVMLSRGQSEYVQHELFNPREFSGIIKRDLHFVAKEWVKPNFDLWEEVYGQHFYTLMVQRRALTEGARFAAELGDQGSAEYYLTQARQIESRIGMHLNQRLGYIQQTVQFEGGHSEKVSGLDTATVLAVLHGSIPDGYFNVDSSWVMSTMFKIEKSFQTLYPINGRPDDLGTAIGRYPEDVFFGGNPWFLTTNAFAEYEFKLSSYLTKGGILVVDNLNLNFLQSVMKKSLSVGLKISPNTKQHTDLALALLDRADGHVKRTAAHTANGGSQSEQFNRFNGYMLSAHDLTWSYASFITMAQARESALTLRGFRK